MWEIGQIQGRPKPCIFDGRISSKAVALWKASSWDESLHSLLDLSGNGLHAQSGSASSPNTNDPLRLQFSGEKYVYMTGSAGNYPRAADSVPISITSDIEIRAVVAPTDYTPGTSMRVVAKEFGAGNRSYALGIETGGHLALVTWDGSDTQRVYTSSVPTGFTDGQKAAVRATLDVDDGASGSVARFYTSLDYNPATGLGTWTQLGNDRTSTSHSIADVAAALEIGSRANGAGLLFSGRVYAVQIYSGIGGTRVANFRADQLVEPYASYTDDDGVQWTLNRSASGRKLAVVDRDMFLLGTDDYFEVADHPLLDFGAGDNFTSVVLARTYGTKATQVRLAKKEGSAGTFLGYALRASSATPGTLFFECDTGTDQSTTLANSPTSGVMSLLAGVKASSTLQVLDVPAQSSGAFTDGSLANSVPLRIGAYSAASAADFGEFEFIAAAVFREALSASDLARLKRELLA